MFIVDAPVSESGDANSISTTNKEEESTCLQKLNDDVYKITMILFDDKIDFKVVMIDSLDKWESSNTLKFFQNYKAFSFAENIRDVYEAIQFKLKPDEIKILKDGDILTLCFEFILINKKINFFLELKHKIPDISIDVLNQMMTEIKNLRNEVSEIKLENSNLKKDINRIFILAGYGAGYGGEQIKTFKFLNKTVFCFKVDAQKNIKDFNNFNQFHEMDWYSPDSSEEANEIINNFYDNYKKYGLDNQSFWMITHGVKTDPKNKKVGKYVISSDGGGAHIGDDGEEGKCNGTGFTAFRKPSCSFANPQTFGKCCNWDTKHKNAIVLLQSR